MVLISLRAVVCTGYSIFIIKGGKLCSIHVWNCLYLCQRQSGLDVMHLKCIWKLQPTIVTKQLIRINCNSSPIHDKLGITAFWIISLCIMSIYLSTFYLMLMFYLFFCHLWTLTESLASWHTTETLFWCYSDPVIYYSLASPYMSCFQHIKDTIFTCCLIYLTQ